MDKKKQKTDEVEIKMEECKVEPVEILEEPVAPVWGVFCGCTAPERWGVFCG